jgi:hypothetical protein
MSDKSSTSSISASSCRAEARMWPSRCDLVAPGAVAGSASVQRRPQFVADTRHEGRLVAVGLLGAQHFLAQRIGLLALGDVEVDPGHDAARPRRVVDQAPARGEPVLRAVGPAHTQLGAVGLAELDMALRQQVHRAPVVGVVAERRQLFGAARVGRVEAAQAVHRLVPVTRRPRNGSGHARAAAPPRPGAAR